MSERLLEILADLNIKFQPIDESNKSKVELEVEFANNNPGNLYENEHNCEICKNKRLVYFVAKDEKGAEFMAARECKCMATIRTLRRAKRSGLGNILTDYTFAKYETPEDWQSAIKAKAQAFCKDDLAKWFYIGGQTGAGKTHLCTAICGHYIKKGLDCQYMLWRDDAAMLKAAVTDFEAYQKHIARFKDAPVLYIDDFWKTQDKSAPTQGDVNLAFEILNYRIMAEDKTTILSSEFTIAEALAFDEATIGRIYHRTGDYKINIDRDMGKNYRLKA